MAGESAGGTPLRLKDLLELDCDSCSAAGFRCYPRRLGESAAAPVRHLLQSPSLRRRHPGKLSHLSRSLSRRLGRGGGFWRRRDDEDDADADAAAASTGRCGASSEELDTSSESSDNSSGRTSRSRRSRSESDSDFSSATSASEDSGVLHHPSLAAAGDEHEVAMKRVSKEGSGSEAEADDKEQLSPVAVMDFPFGDEDEDDLRRDTGGVACSPSFSLARLQEGTTHKTRRFGSRVELGPMNLEALLAATSDADDVPAQQMMTQHRTEDAAAAPTCASRAGVHDVPAEEEDDLIPLLMGTLSSAGLDGVSERLLLDFFVETTKRRRSEAHAEAELHAPPPAARGVLLRKAGRRVDGDAAVAAARGWLEGTGTTERWGLVDVVSGGAAIVAEMERGRRWMQVAEEEREVGAVVAWMLADQLVDEVMRCLLV